MIGKNENADVDNTNNTRVNIISEKRKLLQDTSAKLQEDVRLCFEQLAKVLQTREKQLLRQVQAVHNQQLSIIQSNWERVPSVQSIKVNLSRQQELQDSIRTFGNLVSFESDGIVVSDAEPYKIEEYVEANKDHISFDKSIKIDREEKIFATADERLENSLDSELSFNTSSEADSTFENEITVLMNHNYSSSSDGLKEDNETQKLSTVEDEKDTFDRSTSNCDENSTNIRDYSLHNIKKTESESSEKTDNFIDLNNIECTVPEKNVIANELNCSNKESTDIYCSTDSGSSAESSEKSNDRFMNKKSQDTDQHPKQIQQWLQQILVETETEPTIHEVEQFAEISKSRFKEFQFPLET